MRKSEKDSEVHIKREKGRRRGRWSVREEDGVQERKMECKRGRWSVREEDGV